MQAVVLAAGKGTRLRPLTEDKPKVLVEVDGKPLIEDVFDNLLEIGVTELVVVVGYQKEQIIERYGDEYEDVPITYTHQREQLGLAHAILQAEPHVDDDFVLMLGTISSGRTSRTSSTASGKTAPTPPSSLRSPTRRPPGTACSTPTSTARSSR